MARPSRFFLMTLDGRAGPAKATTLAEESPRCLF